MKTQMTAIDKQILVDMRAKYAEYKRADKTLQDLAEDIGFKSHGTLGNALNYGIATPRTLGMMEKFLAKN